MSAALTKLVIQRIEVRQQMRYALSDWTDHGMNRARFLIVVVFALAPLFAVLHSWLWLYAFYAAMLLPRLGRQKRMKWFESLADLKAFVAALKSEHEGDAK